MTRRALTVFLSLTCIALAACNTGTPSYWGRDAVTVSSQGMTFLVRQNGLMAEAVRTNTMFPPPTLATVSAAAMVAIENATGCMSIETRGDPSVVEARLKCGSVTAPKFPRGPTTIFCDAGEVTVDPVGAVDFHLRCG
ncbi:MAG: hypothetical protein MK098_04065 [Marinovum sp.]|nr:hypothetical protein [Marinovum sp.]